MAPHATPFSLETEAIHSGRRIDPATGALTEPIHLSTTFERDGDGGYARGYVYGRSGNPNRDALETALATLEKGTATATFASGSAATFSLLQALSPDAHVVAPLSVYFGVQQMLRDIFAPWGLSYTLVDTPDLGAVAEALRPNTRLVLIETPSNPQLAVTDIRAVADLAHQANAYLACDNTIASPVLQTPLTLGADLVIHATTKYLAGHGDVIGGAVVTREPNPLFDQLRLVQTIGGVVPSPFDCWLTLRGLQTLPLRVRAQAQAAQAIAIWLAQHPAVEQVLYPGLPEHPGHGVAQKQMQGYGGLLSFLVKGDQERAMAIAAKTSLIARATSFGSPHSSIEHRASIEQGTQTAPNLLRLSVGLEHVDDLIADLDQVLNSGVN
ncbi:trans-sulfuration enzyme family protein [Nodosilinea sp. PGN35]|uniref:trans-sulfuration enzyme family protein n=1 Tax=Nodosilinea sp. PGN35 TaxID=3020489 RepID=UPI0023B2E008|nr:PLP-dependent transferase [Nodosilinea sp. TSF1-S3]MDF0365290.1 PLP-dependent transferase [Nodosilinea sp. TSF1-S3]